MDKYTKIIQFKTVLDNSSAKVVEKKLSNITDAIKTPLSEMSKGFFSNFKKETQSTVDELNKQIESLNDKYRMIKSQKGLVEERMKSAEGYEDFVQAKEASEKIEQLKEEISNLSLSEDNEELIKEKKNEIKEQQKIVDKFEKNSKDFGQLMDALYDNSKLDEQLEELEESLLETNSELRLEREKRELEKRTVDWRATGANLQNAIGTMLDKITSSLTGIATELVQGVLEEIQNMASYSLSTTLKINQNARDLALQYGLTDVQTYAYSKVKEEMGISSEEDVWLMTPAQQERFAERIGYYSGQYEKLTNKKFFESYEKFQARFNDLKQEVQMKLIEFFVTNEDDIMFALETSTKVLGSILDLISSMNFSESKSSLSDMINNYSTSNKNTNIKVDTTFNGVSVNDQMKLRQIGNELNRTLINQLDNA